MRVGAGAAGAVLAGACGVFTAYAAFQPALKEDAEKRAGTFQEQHYEDRKDNVLSQAIISDLKEAKQEVTKYDNGGFAWGIRKFLFGAKPQQTTTEATSTPVPQEQKDK